MGDTLTIGGGERPTRVVAVEIRPADARAAAAVGTLYLDIDRAALVRFRFTFTPAAYRDKTVEEITVLLENALQDGVRWLPWKQSIVITRGSAWLDLPLRTVIRGDWMIDDYQLGVRHPASIFTGPFIGGLRAPRADTTWNAPLADALGGLGATDKDVAAARDAAARAIGDRLSGLPRVRFRGGGISDFASVNRVQGMVGAIGVRFAPGRALSIDARLGIGRSDSRVIGGVHASLHRGPTQWTVGASRAVRDVSDLVIVSGVANSIGAAITGNDRLDWLLVERVGGTIRHEFSAAAITVDAAREWTWSVATRFDPIAGRTRFNPPLGSGQADMLRVQLAGTDAGSLQWRVAAEHGDGASSWSRMSVDARTSVEAGRGEVTARLHAGAGTSGLPRHRMFVLGGRGTLPGVDHRSIGGRQAALIEVGWMHRAAVPTPPIPKVPDVALPSRIGVFGALGWSGGAVADVPWRPSERVEAVVGVRLDLWGPLGRVEAGINTRTGQVAIVVDAHPDWWPVL